MTRSRIPLGLAAVLAGATVLFVVLGFVFNLLLLVVALPFGLATYLLWLHATGRLARRIRRRAADEGRGEPDRRARSRADARQAGHGQHGPRAATDPSTRSMDRQEALETLGLDRGADQRAIRRAYRERAKAVHPDADQGDEDTFRRVTAAYERLRPPHRGKG